MWGPRRTQKGQRVRRQSILQVMSKRLTHTDASHPWQALSWKWTTRRQQPGGKCYGETCSKRDVWETSKSGFGVSPEMLGDIPPRRETFELRSRSEIAVCPGRGAHKNKRQETGGKGPMGQADREM